MDELRPNVSLGGLEDSGTACPEILNSAKRELGAFMLAVEEVYGFEQARVSVEDWLEELEFKGFVSGPTLHDWRLITIAAAVRLATRIVNVKHQNAAVQRLA